jgi:hypothetical protein
MAKRTRIEGPCSHTSSNSSSWFSFRILAGAVFFLRLVYDKKKLYNFTNYTLLQIEHFSKFNIVFIDFIDLQIFSSILSYPFSSPLHLNYRNWSTNYLVLVSCCPAHGCTRCTHFSGPGKVSEILQLSKKESYTLLKAPLVKVSPSPCFWGHIRYQVSSLLHCSRAYFGVINCSAIHAVKTRWVSVKNIESGIR